MIGQVQRAGRQAAMIAAVPASGITQNRAAGSTRNGTNSSSAIGGWMKDSSLNWNGPATSFARYGVPVSTQRRVASM